jgi:hypothetical protein
MTNIDFLPLERRRERQQRHVRLCHLAAIVAVIGLMATAAMMQRHRWRQAQADLAAITPAYEAAVRLHSRIAHVRSQLSRVQSQAELCTYLRHPWPRTQLLAAMLGPLPEDVTLKQVQILREPPETTPPADKQGDEMRLRSLSPVERDMTKLRDRIDPMRTVMVLHGTAGDSAVLHRYLEALDATEIFDRAELDWFERGERGEPLRFRVVLSVQPGYGQAGGPAKHGTEGLARTARAAQDASPAAQERAQPSAAVPHSKVARRTP